MASIQYVESEDIVRKCETTKRVLGRKVGKRIVLIAPLNEAVVDVVPGNGGFQIQFREDQSSRTQSCACRVSLKPVVSDDHVSAAMQNKEVLEPNGTRISYLRVVCVHIDTNAFSRCDILMQLA